MEVNESIDISGLPERNVHDSVIMAVHDSEDAERTTKYKLTPGFKFTTCKPPCKM